MPNNSGNGYIAPVTVAQGGDALYFRINKGAYLTGSSGTSGAYVEVTASDPNYVASNILNGTSIFNLAGSAGRSASGTITSSSSTQTFSFGAQNFNFYTVTVSGLDFTPSRIVIDSTANISGGDFTLYDAGANFQGTGAVILTSGETMFTLQSPAYVNSSGFLVPVDSASQSYRWFAYED